MNPSPLSLILFGLIWFLKLLDQFDKLSNQFINFNLNQLWQVSNWRLFQNWSRFNSFIHFDFKYRYFIISILIQFQDRLNDFNIVLPCKPLTGVPTNNLQIRFYQPGSNHRNQWEGGERGGFISPKTSRLKCIHL